MPYFCQSKSLNFFAFPIRKLRHKFLSVNKYLTNHSHAKDGDSYETTVPFLRNLISCLCGDLDEKSRYRSISGAG